MTFYSLPNEIHLSIIELTRPVYRCCYEPETWHNITYVCQLWRKLSQKRYLDHAVFWRQMTQFLLKVDDLQVVDKSRRLNPELWGDRSAVSFRVDSVEDINRIWEWLATTSEWKGWLKTIYLRKRHDAETTLPGTLCALPQVEMRQFGFMSGNVLNNKSLLEFLRSPRRLDALGRPVLFEEKTCQKHHDLQRRENYQIACQVVEFLMTTNITCLDLTYKRTFFPHRNHTEPIYPMMGHLESSGAFFRALFQLSQQLKVFFYRGRGSEDMLEKVSGTWAQLEYMMIELDVLDPAGYYWVDIHRHAEHEFNDHEDFRFDEVAEARAYAKEHYSDSEEDEDESEEDDIGEDEYGLADGLDRVYTNLDTDEDPDPELPLHWSEEEKQAEIIRRSDANQRVLRRVFPYIDYTVRKQRLDLLFKNVSRALQRMPKLNFLVVGVNQGAQSPEFILLLGHIAIEDTVLVSEKPWAHRQLKARLNVLINSNDLSIDIIAENWQSVERVPAWDVQGLAFAPGTPKSLRVKDLPASEKYAPFPRRTEDHGDSSELRVVCTKRYSPNDETLNILREIFGSVGVENWMDFKSLRPVAFRQW